MRFRGPIKPRLTVHPLTGETIVPIGVVGGRPVWPIMGGAPDDPDDDPDEDGDPDDSGDGDPDGTDTKKKSTKDGDDDTVSREEFQALLKRMRAADKRATKAEKELQEKKDAELGDLDRATKQAEELQKQVETLQGEVSTLRLQNAFLTANKHKWHDPDTALDLAARHGYLDDAVDDDGEVDKVELGKALDRLAKEKEFLVQKEEKKDDSPGGPSGEPGGGRSDNSKDAKAKSEALRRRFPALR
jgi:hypothetical protein